MIAGAIDPLTPLPGPPPQAMEPSSALASNAVIPQGWRLTPYGWEDASAWAQPIVQPDINALIDQQRSLQPAWIRFSFERISGVPPLMIALLQIIAVAIIINLSNRSKSVRALAKQKSESDDLLFLA